jgi:hypothetical protein
MDKGGEAPTWWPHNGGGLLPSLLAPHPPPRLSHTLAQVMNINSSDVCLTLTSGGCNALNLLINGAKEVYSVDCNPAQTALLELKQVRACMPCVLEGAWEEESEGVSAGRRAGVAPGMSVWIRV